MPARSGKAQGDRVSEYLANEYLAMIEVEREDYAAAMARCRPLLEIGARLREGSEYPFARALEALCGYGIDGRDTGLDARLQAVRAADAKQRLTFLLNRAAALDIRCGQWDRALRGRSTEALALAELMQRPTEMLLARVVIEVINRKHRKAEDGANLESIEKISAGTVAGWARSGPPRCWPMRSEVLMADVILERQFNPRLSPEDFRAMAMESADCVPLYRVTWRESLMAADGRRLLCLFEAPDTEAVRMVATDPQPGPKSPGLARCTTRAGRRCHVVVERRFANPVTVADSAGQGRRRRLVPAAAPRQLPAHFLLAGWQGDVLPVPGTGCGGIRLAQSKAGMPMERVWACQAFSPADFAGIEDRG